MEFTGMVYVGDAWFTRFNGHDASWLTLITAHEIAHQWWYALVTNDQGRAPYLDEALSIYSEVLYLERFVPDLVSWWWSFRVQQHNPDGFVDSQVYEYWNVRLYINAVYLRGANMLQEMRVLLGDTAFFGWLRAYLAGDEGRIATPADFWGALGTSDYRRMADIRAQYLREPDPLGLTTNAAASPGDSGQDDTLSSDAPAPQPTSAQP
jgi:aminopeptidase N